MAGIGGERTRWANVIGSWIRHWKSRGYRRRDCRWGDGIQKRRNVGSRGVSDNHSTVYPANTSPYESEIYVEVDHYVLYEDNSTVGIKVPGDEICLAGDRLRTIDPWGFYETKTDESKCRWLDYGEKDEFKCTRDAYRVIMINSYLSSPVNYTANICLAYDKSSCSWRDPGDAPEREICKVRGSYKGIWAESTQFYYRCAKSTIQSYTHPLQYQVRFVQDVEFPGEGLSKRIVQLEMRPIPRCD